MIDKIIENLLLERNVEKATVEYTTDEAIKEHKEQCDFLIALLEKEKTNGWIPCSERLPQEHKLYDITFKNDVGIHSDQAIYNPFLKRWLWDADETELVENEVLAWVEKRVPYHQKKEEYYE